MLIPDRAGPDWEAAMKPLLQRFGERLRRSGFRRQLSLIVSAAILCLALVSSLVNALEASRQVRLYLVDAGEQVAATLARQSALALLYGAPDNAHDAVSTTLTFPDVLQVGIYDATGQPLLREGKQQGLPELPPRAQPPRRPMLDDEDSGHWVFSAPVQAGDPASPFEMQERAANTLGYVRVVIAKTTQDRLVTYLVGSNLLTTFTVAALLLVLLNLLASRLTQPLRDLSALMRRAEAGESGLRARASGSREMVEMAQAFNQMMTVLEQREGELTASRDEAVRTALMKAQFAATVSHEIRTPLNGVIGMLEMLRAMPLPQRPRECIDEAWSSARSLTELVDEILDFSKMDAGKLVLDHIDFDLRSQLERVIDMLAPAAREKGLSIGYLMAPDVPELIHADVVRLRQVLVNLIGNAVKFTHRGEVGVYVSTVPAPDHLVGLRVEVRDTGIGIAREALDRLFEAFSQADSSTTRKYGGTGLGLAICKQLVELMGGSISATSEPGAGSCFVFTIACRRSASAGDGTAALLHGDRVLVADGSKIVREFFRASIERDGGRCTAVGDASQALNALRDAQLSGDAYALVAVDVSMRDATGADLPSRIRGNAAHAGVRLLALTTYGAARTAGALGADAYLDKPLHLAHLLEAVRRQLLRTAADTADAALGSTTVAAIHHHEVLIAEDNRTNKVVAAGLLRLLGCRCTLASNGSEAVEAASRHHFDLILMDCSMPEIDGYEATARIRAMETTTGVRTPIVAMTAHAQRGDAEKCLAAGMDDYLAKPITLATLQQMIERWLPAPARAASSLPPPAPLADGLGEVLDTQVFESLRSALGPAIAEAVTVFLEDIPGYFETLEAAVERGDEGETRATLHAVRGASGNLGAVQLARQAEAAREAAAAGRVGEVREAMPRLRDAFDAVASVLTTGLPGGERSEEASALVLVVDDDRSTRTALRYTLQRNGFRVEEASDGAQALAMLERISPAVILMDAVMPVMDGFEACAQIKQRPEGSHVPVLMITALEDNTSVERAFSAGATDYIPKPIHFAVLSQRVRGIIDASRAERRIRRLAYNDSLTGLPNRAQFAEQLARYIDRAKLDGEPVAVLFLDLDRFKYINDSLGHEMGDRLLSSVARRIRGAVRQADCVARLGGDEFTVALSASAAAAAAAAQHISRSLARPFHLEGHDIFVAASIGVALYPQDGTDAGELLKHADMAMYRAKKDGSGVRFFEASMEHLMSGHLQLENDLHRALERDELWVAYQPKARVSTGAVVGMEALVRWQHPVRGEISPGDFIPLAEETGLILAIGEWMLRSVCRQVQSWNAAGMAPLRVSVNISGRQLAQANFVETVDRILQGSGLPAHLLELEITESVLMQHAENTLEMLRGLRALGVSLSIDDFGTGYSSLAYLKRFPVDAVKIDRAFVQDLPDNADDAAIATAMIALAHSLRLEVVAEGVETHTQLAFLRQRDCDQIQGFLLSPPLPASQFEQVFLASSGVPQGLE